MLNQKTVNTSPDLITLATYSLSFRRRVSRHNVNISHVTDTSVVLESDSLSDIEKTESEIFSSTADIVITKYMIKDEDLGILIKCRKDGDITDCAYLERVAGATVHFVFRDVSNLNENIVFIVAPKSQSSTAEAVFTVKFEADQALQQIIQQKDQALQQKDQALQQKDQALQQKDQALQQKDMEREQVIQQIVQQKDQALQQKDQAFNRKTK